MVEGKKKHFIDNIFNPFLEAKLMELEDYFYENRKVIKNRILGSFKKLLSDCEEKVYFDVSYLVCTILRSNILEQKYVCTIMVYDEGFYMSNGVKIGEIDFSDIYTYYEESHRYGLKNFRRYVGALNEADVKMISMKNLEKFNDVVEKAIRYSLYEITELEVYQKISKSNEFQFIVGEYFEFTTIVHTENKNKNKFELKKQLESKETNEMIIVTEDFRELELENIILVSKTILFNDYNYSNIDKFVFNLCILIGTRYTNCKFGEVGFYKSMLSATDFRNSKFIECVFRECIMYLENDGIRYTETNFSNCYFVDVKFIGCAFNGVDFTNSNIEKVDIIDTIFYKCIFSESQKVFLKSIDNKIIDNNKFI